MTENDLKLAFDQAAIWVVTDSNGVITYVSKLFCEVSGFSATELIGKTHKVINSGYHSKSFFANLWDTISSGKVWTGRIKNKTKQKEDFWLDTSIIPFVNDEGFPYQYVAIRHDVSHEVELQGELEKSQKELSAQKYALDQSAIVAITDARGKIVYVNDKFCDISKFSREELLGQNHRIVNSGYHPGQFFVDMWETISAGKIWNGEICNRAKDSSLYWVHTTIVPFLDEENKPYQYVAIRFDLTDQKLTEEKLEKERAALFYSEKMASLGIMAAGIGHELGNPLGALRGRLEMLENLAERESSSFGKTVKDAVVRIIGISDRMTKIIRGLKSYARDGSKDPLSSVTLNQLIEDILEYTSDRLEKDGIQIRKKGFENEVKLNCREAEIGQIVVNLISNSIDAIEGLDEKWIEVELKNYSEDIEILVTDSGPGIPEEIRSKIFHPFYTTKPAGRGTGLGLGILKRIIDSHKGFIEINSASPNTQFVVRLPKNF